MTAIYVVIDAVRGSAPRDAGTAMLVTATGTRGTIGGGALEYRAIRRARALLDQGATGEETIPLGPGLGQCCGGAVSLQFTYETHLIDLEQFMPALPSSPQVALWLWGAGHVGRAVMRIAHQSHCKITWIDDAADRFPDIIPKAVDHVVATDMPLLAKRADQQAHHLIFTYSHDTDLALCAALLKRSVRSIGLIGSDTKWARFAKRLRAMGLDPGPITCPIGDKTRGKHPDVIAHSTLEHILTKTGVTA